MDHILENNDNPVPDLANQGTTSGPSASSAMDLDGVDEDDAAAIRAALGKSSASVAPGSSANVPEGAEAKVSQPCRSS